MSDRPILFLDVDGVLNALGGDHPRVLVGGIPCDVPFGTEQRVKRLAEHFEIVWATAWMGTADRAWRFVLNLPTESHWPYVAWGDMKLPAILRWAKDRAWAFVDDDVEYELRKLSWDRSMLNGLLVAPDPLIGLTDEHVDQFLSFAAAERERMDLEGAC